MPKISVWPLRTPLLYTGSSLDEQVPSAMTGISYPLRFRISSTSAFRYRNAGSSGSVRSWSAAFSLSIGSVSSSSRSVSPMTGVCGTCSALKICGSVRLMGCCPVILPSGPYSGSYLTWLRSVSAVFHTWSPFSSFTGTSSVPVTWGPVTSFSPVSTRKNSVSSGNPEKISSYPPVPDSGSTVPEEVTINGSWSKPFPLPSSPSMEAESSGMETTDVPLKEAAPSGVSKPAPLLVHWPERPLTDSSYPSLLDSSFT